MLLGDFNFKPDDGMYELYMNGTLSPNHPCYLEIPERLKWVPDVEPVRSAYLEAKMARNRSTLTMPESRSRTTSRKL